MRDELQFAHKVRQVLDHGAENVGKGIAGRLQAARQKALGHQKISVAGLSLAGAGRFTTETFQHAGRMTFAILALIIGVVCSYYWSYFEQAIENEALDSALLSDDLPPAALMDKGFQKWLESSSQPSQ